MTKTNLQHCVLLLLAVVVHMHGGAHAFSTLAPPAPTATTKQQQAQDVARTSFKITWELDVEERIRRSLDDHTPDQMPYLVAVAGIPGR